MGGVMCKVNFAAYVKRTMPHHRTVWNSMRQNAAKTSRSCGRVTLDRQYVEAYLDLQNGARNRYAYAAATRPEAPSIGARRRAQPTSGCRQRSAVQWEPVLRSQGSGSGSLRDGAASRRRPDARQRCGSTIRSLPTNLLQGAEHTRGFWSSRARTPAPRAKRGPQALRQGGGLRHCSQSQTARLDDATVSRRHRGGIRHQSSPTQLGAGPGAQKKIASSLSGMG